MVAHTSTGAPTAKATPPRRGAGRRIGVRDRGWFDVNHLRVLGAFDGVTVAGLRFALAGLHAAQPRHPAVCLVDREANRWVPLSTVEFAAHVERCVVEVDDPGGPDDAAVDAVARYLIDLRREGAPVVLAVCRGFVGAKVSHVIGDGRALNALLPELIRAAAEHCAASPTPVASAALPLPRAALRHFGRHPAQLLRALRDARRPAAAVGTVPWLPDPAYVSVRSSTALGEIRAWRDSQLPGVSVAALQFAALAAALQRCGMPVLEPGAVVLVDARRHLPSERGADGNFSCGLYLRPESLTDPVAMHRALTGRLSSGAALVMLTLRAGRMLLMPGHGDQPAPQWRTAEPSPKLTLTHIGRLDPYLDLPWVREPAQRFNVSVPTTSGPEAITTSFSELAGVLYVNLSFHRSTFDPSVVRRAARLACERPVELLSGG